MKFLYVPYWYNYYHKQFVKLHGKSINSTAYIWKKWFNSLGQLGSFSSYVESGMMRCEVAILPYILCKCINKMKFIVLLLCRPPEGNHKSLKVGTNNFPRLCRHIPYSFILEWWNLSITCQHSCSLTRKYASILFCRIMT